MTGILPLETLVDIVRVEIYEALTVDGLEWVDAARVASSIDESVTPSFVKVAFRQLSATKEVLYETNKHPLQGEVKTGRVSISAAGIKKVEQSLQDPSSFHSAYQQNGIDGVNIPFVGVMLAPASDRFIEYNHNQIAADQARGLIRELKDGLQGSNDLPNELNEVKQSAITELDALDILLSSSKVRAVSALGLAQKVLPWIAEKAGAATVAELARQALSAIIKWLC